MAVEPKPRFKKAPISRAPSAVRCNRPCARAHVSTAGTPIIVGDRWAFLSKRLLGGRIDRSINRHNTISLPGITWHTQAPECLSAPDVFEPATPAHDRVRMRCPSRYACLRLGQHAMAFECIII